MDQQTRADLKMMLNGWTREINTNIELMEHLAGNDLAKGSPLEGLIMYATSLRVRIRQEIHNLEKKDERET